MLTVFLQEGCSLDFIPAADVAAGDVVVVGELVGVVQRDIKASELGCIAVEGVYEIPKSSVAGSAIANGSRLFWDAAAKVATTNAAAGANKALGKSIWPTVDADTKVRVRLSQ